MVKKKKRRPSQVTWRKYSSVGMKDVKEEKKNHIFIVNMRT